MPTLTQIQQTILSAQYLQATLSDANRAQLSVGNCLANWWQIKQINRNTVALGFQVNRGDYISSTTLMLYDCLNSTIGLDPTNNNIDPNFQNPNITLDVTVINTGTPVYIVPFSGVANLTINWSSNVPGYTKTYAQLIGNNPNPFVYFDGVNSDTPSGQPFIINKLGGVVQSVTFDWGTSQSGYIRF